MDSSVLRMYPPAASNCFNRFVYVPSSAVAQSTPTFLKCLCLSCRQPQPQDDRRRSRRASASRSRSRSRSRSPRRTERSEKSKEEREEAAKRAAIDELTRDQRTVFVNQLTMKVGDGCWMFALLKFDVLEGSYGAFWDALLGAGASVLCWVKVSLGHYFHACHNSCPVAVFR